MLQSYLVGGFEKIDTLPLVVLGFHKGMSKISEIESAGQQEDTNEVLQLHSNQAEPTNNPFVKKCLIKQIKYFLTFPKGFSVFGAKQLPMSISQEIGVPAPAKFLGV